jgi:hypothetical protein
MKLQRGQKLCKNCNNTNGSRARACKHCKKEFEVRGDSITKLKKKRKNKNFSKVDWKELKLGDIVYVKGRTGNYYIGQDGTKTYTTDKGVYTVVDVKDEGIFAYGKKGNTFIYMGEERQSKYLSSMFQAPHKIYIKKQPELAQVV